MTRTTQGWFSVLAAVGMTMALIGAEVANLSSWDPVTTPAFVGKAFVHLAAVIAAFVGGQLVPTAERWRDKEG
jgi:hypothetical protein